MATRKMQLGKSFRLFPGNDTDATAAADFTMVENENEYELTWDGDVEEISTKSGGRERTPGDISVEIKFDFNEVYEDAGLEIVKNAINQVWPFQIRDVSGTEQTIYIEGSFIVSNFSEKAGAKGAREGSVTLQSSGTIKRNSPPRALTTP